LSGATPSRKSTVFTLGIILDELIHGAPYFQTSDDILNQMSNYKIYLVEFKVRGESLNPILKNTLFEMMNKEPTKRLDLLEAKRRLSLQKYITTESRSTLTLTSRAARKP
jgi:serine/threonine protein kinase